MLGCCVFVGTPPSCDTGEAGHSHCGPRQGRGRPYEEDLGAPSQGQEKQGPWEAKPGCRATQGRTGSSLGFWVRCHSGCCRVGLEAGHQTRGWARPMGDSEVSAGGMGATEGPGHVRGGCGGRETFRMDPTCLPDRNAVGCVPPTDRMSILGMVVRAKWVLGKGHAGALEGRVPKSMVGGPEARTEDRKEELGSEQLGDIPEHRALLASSQKVPEGPRRSQVLLAGWGCPRDKRG